MFGQENLSNAREKKSQSRRDEFWLKDRNEFYRKDVKPERKTLGEQRAFS
jgi:hypothetical protein